MIISAKGRASAPEGASLDLDRLDHEIRQCLRVTGVPRYFQGWADRPVLFGAVWEASRPLVETRAFEEAADRVRASAVALADGLGRLSALGPAALGESQAFQAEAAVMLYFYLDAKLLVLNAALQLALEGAGTTAEPAGPPPELIERGAPPRMALMEAVDERDFKRPHGALASSDLLNLALWPRYLEAAWDRLKPSACEPQYQEACDRLREQARSLAAALPLKPGLAREALLPEDLSHALGHAGAQERLLPALTLNSALLALDWQAPEILRRSPFPALPRGAQEVL